MQCTVQSNKVVLRRSLRNTHRGCDQVARSIARFLGEAAVLLLLYIAVTIFRYRRFRFRFGYPYHTATWVALALSLEHHKFTV